jgi:hypothetical protein
VPPRSPKLNGYVERAQWAHKEEFYACCEGALDSPSLNKALRRWERVYNMIRHHHSLGRSPPPQYLWECFPYLALAA